LDVVEFTCVEVDWGGIQFKFHYNPSQHMWIDANPTTSKQGLSILKKKRCNLRFVYLVALVAAKRAVRINTAVCIALFEASSIVAIYMNVPTTAMKESQKSKNWTQIQYNGIEEM
jgi:hypothetical protein